MRRFSKTALLALAALMLMSLAAPTFAAEREPAAAAPAPAAQKPGAAAAAAKPNVTTAAPTAQQSAKTKPPVPPGVDPGGVAIAIIGPGVEYTDPEIAQRLARDGEGEIIGWDFIDGDRRPFEPSGPVCHFVDCEASILFKRVANEASVSRFEIFRTILGSPKSKNWSVVEKQLASAITMAAQSPASIVLLPVCSQPIIEEASRRFPDQLFITPTFWYDGRKLNHLSNILVAGGANAECESWGPELEISAATRCNVVLLDGQISLKADDEEAAARIAALAARLKAAEPKITAAEMKQRILSLAKPLPDGPKGPRPYGWIADPLSHFPPK